jgi:hypothetical protein
MAGLVRVQSCFRIAVVDPCGQIRRPRRDLHARVHLSGHSERSGRAPAAAATGPAAGAGCGAAACRQAGPGTDAATCRVLACRFAAVLELHPSHGGARCSRPHGNNVRHAASCCAARLRRRSMPPSGRATWSTTRWGLRAAARVLMSWPTSRSTVSGHPCSCSLIQAGSTPAWMHSHSRSAVALRGHLSCACSQAYMALMQDHLVKMGLLEVR